VHISFHELRDDVDVLVAGHTRWFGHVKHLDHVLVVKELEQLDFSDNAFCVNQILESLWHLFDCDLDVLLVVVSTANNTVGAISDLLDVLKLFIDAESRSRTEEFVLSIGFWRALLDWALNLLSHFLFEFGSLVGSCLLLLSSLCLSLGLHSLALSPLVLSTLLGSLLSSRLLLHVLGLRALTAIATSFDSLLGVAVSV